MADILSITNLKVVGNQGHAPLVSGIDLAIGEGELVGLVGESGSGKTTVGLSCLGFQRAGTRIAEGDVVVAGRALSLETPAGLVRLRRRDIAYVPQSATSALNPALSIGRQLRDRLAADTQDVEARLLDALEQVALPRDRAFLARYPHQLSGGQQQRVTIAAAFMNDPKLIIFDEPTTGLDVAVQEQIVGMIAAMFRTRRTAGLFISHDLAVVARLCTRTVVMRSGGIVEEGATRKILKEPQAPYVKALVDAVPSLSRNLKALAEAPPQQGGEGGRTLSARGINAHHGSLQTLFDINLSFPAGTCTAIVGESGSGKTTLCRSLIGLHTHYSGSVELDGAVLEKKAARRTPLQRRDVQYIFQSPFEALNPRLTVGELIAQPLAFFGERPGQDLVRDQLEKVSLSASAAAKYPHQLSGGERQRVAIARALALKPRVLLCDEITSALDVSVQARVMELIAELRRQMHLTVVFVTHNLALVPEIAERVAVMRQGRIVDAGPTAEVFAAPRSDFTRALLDKTPDIADAFAA